MEQQHFDYICEILSRFFGSEFTVTNIKEKSSETSDVDGSENLQKSA